MKGHQLFIIHIIITQGKNYPLSMIRMMTTVKNCQLLIIRIKTTQIKGYQLLEIYNCCLQFNDNWSKKLLSRLALAKVVKVDSQSKAIWAKILYIKPISLLETINKVVRRFGKIVYNQVRFFRCNQIYFSVIEVPTKTMQANHFCVDSQACNVAVFCQRKIFFHKKKV